MHYYEKFLNKKPKNPIYHYTTQEGLIGIVKSKQLWASRIHYLNDSKEFSYAIDLLENGFRNVISRAPDLNKILIDKISGWTERISKISIYVGSFSEEKDLLSQWRGYTENGIGFSVGFKYSDIAHIVESQGFSIAACIYDYSTQYTIIENLINHFVKNALIAQEKFDIDQFNERNTHYSNFINSFVQVAPILKDPSFKEEKEWRLISKPIPHNHINIDYRKGNVMLIPYYKFNLCDSGTDMKLFEVVVGPTPYPYHSSTSVFDLLARYNIIFNSVSPSKIPYRQWV